MVALVEVSEAQFVVFERMGLATMPTYTVVTPQYDRRILHEKSISPFKFQHAVNHRSDARHKSRVIFRHPFFSNLGFTVDSWWIPELLAWYHELRDFRGFSGIPDVEGSNPHLSAFSPPAHF